MALVSLPLLLTTLPILALVSVTPLLLRPVVRQQPGWGWLLPFLLAMSAGVAVHVRQSGIEVAYRAGAVILFVFAMIWLARRVSKADVILLRTGFVIAGVVLGSAGAIQVAFLGAGRAMGLSFHPNVYAFSMLLMLFGTLSGLTSHRDRKHQLLVASALLVCLLGVFAAGSRAVVSGLLVGGAVGIGAALLAHVTSRQRYLLALVVAAVATVTGLVALHGSTAENQVVNSEFRYGRLGWYLGDASELVHDPFAGDGRAVRLVHNQAGWERLLTSRLTRVDSGAALVVGLDVYQSPEPVRGTFLRVEAFDHAGRYVAHADEAGWTSGPHASAGAGFKLPESPPRVWTVVRVALPEVPSETHYVRLSIVNADRGPEAIGEYGLATRFFIRPSDAEREATYSQGSIPGLRDIWSLLAQLRGDVHWSVVDIRDQAWRVGWRAATAVPWVGGGPHAWDTIAASSEGSQYGLTNLSHVHNAYLAIVLEWGLVPVLLASAALLSMALKRTAWRVSPNRLPLLTALVTAVAVTAMFDVVILRWDTLVLSIACFVSVLHDNRPRAIEAPE